VTTQLAANLFPGTTQLTLSLRSTPANQLARNYRSARFHDLAVIFSVTSPALLLR
jgi:hypothetical protein